VASPSRNHEDFNRVGFAFRKTCYLSGMARPRKPSETAQKSAIKINLTAAEKVQLLARAQAAGLPIATYIRRALFNRKMIDIRRREAGIGLLAIAERLRQIGLDQIQTEIEAVAEKLVESR
jgi:ribulose 1,5-bisphosphate carboxylase large subunit-like protein